MRWEIIMKSDLLMTGWSSNGIFENTVLALAWRERGKPQKNQFECLVNRSVYELNTSQMQI
jgi:hypothetical protein